ncbi:dTDP-4-dehydrorhamnose reductase [Campylobacter sp. US33a]|uniref:dTDP-4-dehydrorhamnose reductase n=1 Tax=Campylobacter sp. US33a TaxID=2498120 RepID=UPI0010683A01|nr:dTDP-4-dehydrorhamnose reductase [Campylobacter sp. US33a]TEY03971.1 dTDP-4-dehydrorhamnose reductase [Campylobacter sp. US33a]
MNNNIVVFGSNGQLAKSLRLISNDYKSYNIFFISIKELNIQNKELLSEYLINNNINTIINCMAYTAVDQAEVEKEKADEVNSNFVDFIAKFSKENNFKFIHISTDYVFNGKTNIPYKEYDKTNPINEYGRTKLKGEQAILSIAPKNTIIIRTSWLYSIYGENFVKTIQKLGMQKQEINVIFDQIGTPTYAKDLAEVILNILPKISNDKPEIYHYSNEGVASWYDFANEIVELLQLECKINPVETKDFPTLASRPNYSVLNKQKIKEKFHIQIPYWRDSLKECIRQMQKELNR